MEDSTLISKILENPTLKSAVDDMVGDKLGVLNLVSLDWKQILLNNPLYQDYHHQKVKFHPIIPREHMSFQNVMKPNDAFQVVVVGTWTLYKDTNEKVSLSCKSCEPLCEIARVMGRIHPDKVLSENLKVSVDNCNARYCKACSLARKKSIEKNMAFDNQWCIWKTKIFNGEKIRNVFTNTLVNDFKEGKFLAIMLLKISALAHFGENSYKIWGRCSDIVVFKENCLLPQEDFHLDIEDFDMDSMRNFESTLDNQENSKDSNKRSASPTDNACGGDLFASTSNHKRSKLIASDDEDNIASTSNDKGLKLIASDDEDTTIASTSNIEGINMIVSDEEIDDDAIEGIPIGAIESESILKNVHYNVQVEQMPM